MDNNKLSGVGSSEIKTSVVTKQILNLPLRKGINLIDPPNTSSIIVFAALNRIWKPSCKSRSSKGLLIKI